MSELEQIVDVSITAETTAPLTADFNIPLILAEFEDFTDSRTRTYFGTDDLASDFDVTSDVFIMGSLLFGQEQGPASIVVGRKLADESFTEAYNAVKTENNNWFFVVSPDHTADAQKAIAAAVASDKKVYFTSTQDPAALTTATTDIGSQLKVLGYNQTSVRYSANADTQFPEAAWVGSQGAYTPGANDWEFKRLVGVAPDDSLTGTQIANLVSKNIGYYKTIGGVPVTRNSVMASGRYPDEIILIFWTEARMQESVFGMLINKAKVPMSAAGIALVEAQIRSVLALGVSNGGYVSYTVTVPRISDIPVSQRQQRIAGDFKFSAVLANAIRKVIIRGNVTV